MKLTDLKKPKKTKKELKEEMTLGPTTAEDQDRYPYGLQICFEKDEIDKIPALQKIKADANVQIVGTGFVKEVAITDASEKSGGRKRHRVEIQLQKIGVAEKTNKKPEDMDPDEYKEWRNSNT